jgi:uncharacterized protein (TIGR02001 family)
MRHLLVLGVVGACAAGAASAGGSLGGSVDVTSDYVFHGLSQSQGDPAIQGDVHYRASAAAAAAENFIGLWGSTVSRASTGGTFELNAYAGRTFLLDGSSSATLSLVHYAYPNAQGRPRYDYDELSATWAFEDRVALTVAWTPDTGRYTDRGRGLCCRLLSYDVAVHQSLGRAFTVSAALGYDQLSGASGYAYWNGGVGYTIGAWQLDVSYFALQARAAAAYSGALAARRWVGTVIWRF